MYAQHNEGVQRTKAANSIFSLNCLAGQNVGRWLHVPGDACDVD